MNYQENCTARNSRRYIYALAFLVLVFVFALGLILGAVFAEGILSVLPALIAFAAAILVIIIAIWIVYRKKLY